MCMCLAWCGVGVEGGGEWIRELGFGFTPWSTATAVNSLGETPS